MFETNQVKKKLDLERGCAGNTIFLSAKMSSYCISIFYIAVLIVVKKMKFFSHVVYDTSTIGITHDIVGSSYSITIYKKRMMTCKV